jgi:effector-binding domain-containing protein
MKALRIIFIVLIIIIGAYSIWMATIDPEYRVERSETIEASPDKIYNVVSDFKTWGEWSAWHKMDPDMEITYGESSSGQGATYSWNGEVAGAGTQTITEATPAESMKTHIAFEGMGEADGAWKFERIEPGVTEVTWAFTGESAFFFRIFNLGIDEAVGNDFEQGLSNLKAYVESLPDPSDNVEIEMVQLESMPYYGVKTELAISNMSSDFFGQSYGEIMGYLGEEAGANMLMAPMAFFWDWDEENDRTIVEPAIAVNSEKPGTERIVKKMSYGGPALKAIHMGGYNTEAEHVALGNYMKENKLEWAEGAAAIEVYVTDPGTEPDTSKWITEVYYPYVEPGSASE